MTGSRRAGIVLQERDRVLQRELVDRRVIDREQAQIIAGFGSVTRANARLLAQTRAGFLTRFFVGTVNGGKKAVYTLSAKGAALVGAPGAGIKRNRDAILVGDSFIEHQLSINRVYIALKFSPHPAGVEFLGWRGFPSPLSPAAAIIPDGYTELEAPGRRISAFIEVDLGTERLTIWNGKVDTYVRLAVSGEFQQRFSRDQFRVLVITDSDRRLQSIRSVIAKRTDKIFWFTTFELIRRKGCWSPIWWRPRGDEPCALAGVVR